MDDKPEELGRAKERHNWDTVPMIFEVTARARFNLIGGCTDLENHLAEA